MAPLTVFQLIDIDCIPVAEALRPVGVSGTEAHVVAETCGENDEFPELV